MNRRLLKGALWTLGAAAVAIQLVPVDRTNPPVTREVRWDSDGTRELARRACYDCHSNETEWPWYARVAPASWLVAEDVEEGREHLNFSVWDEPNEDLDEIVEVLEEGEMPLKKYTLLHPSARLTDEERQALIQGLRATLTADPPVAEPDDQEGEEPHDDGGDHS